MSNRNRNNKARLQDALQAIEQGASPDDVLNAMDADTRADLEPLLRLALHMEAMSHPEPTKAKNKIKRFPVKKRPNRPRQLLRLATSAAMLVVLAGLLVVAYSMMTERPREQWTSDGYGSWTSDGYGGSSIGVPAVTSRPGNMPGVLSMTATASVLMNRPSVSVPTSTPDVLALTATERIRQVTATVQIQQTATAVAQGIGDACPPQEGWRTHRVQPGETLQSLAEMYRISVGLLASVNCLDETDGIQTGQIIYLPQTPSSVDPLAMTATQQIADMRATAVAQPPANATPSSNIINDVSVQATAQDFQNGQMVYRSDTGEIYVLIDRGQALTYTPAEYSDLSLPDRTVPDGFYVPRQGFGRIWNSDADLSVTLGWAVRPEIGWPMRVIIYENGTVDLYQPNGIMYRVQGDSWQLLPQ